jgi:hypothetical protein
LKQKRLEAKKKGKNQEQEQGGKPKKPEGSQEVAWGRPRTAARQAVGGNREEFTGVVEKKL